jgi:phage major head subunit gpT-like protein
MKTSDRAYEEDIVMAGGGLLERKPEGKSLLYDTFKQGNKKRHTPETFALGFRITEEMYDDDQYNIMNKMTAQLAKAARLTPEVEFGLFLDDFFTGSVYTGADGQALCYSTGHTLTRTGGTYANAPTVGVDLGVTALRAASERMERTLGEDGLPVRIRPSILLVSPTYQWVAAEILKAEKAPYTNENQPNVTQGILGLKYVVNHYMSDADQWNLFADKGMHDVQIIWRKKAMFKNDTEHNTGDAEFSVRMRFTFGFTDWRGVDGSAGGA